MDSTELLFKSKEQDLARRRQTERNAEAAWKEFTGTEAKGDFINLDCVEFNFDLWRLRRKHGRRFDRGWAWYFSRKCAVCGWWTVEESLGDFINLAIRYNNARCLNTRKCKKATWTKI